MRTVQGILTVWLAGAAIILHLAAMMLGLHTAAGNRVMGQGRLRPRMSPVWAKVAAGEPV